MILVMVTIFGVMTTGGCVHAGSGRHHNHNGLLEGVIIGAGAAILGAAIISEVNEPHVYYHNPRYDRGSSYYDDRSEDSDENSHYYSGNNHIRGHWSVERVWVEPIYKEFWNPGHYNRRGHWVDGGYESVIVREGYWKSRKIWVRN